MPELQFNRKDIEDLTRKVGTLEPYLSEQEHALLLAIFAAASERAEPRTRAATLPTAGMEHPTREAGTPRQATFGELQQQLLQIIQRLLLLMITKYQNLVNIDLEYVEYILLINILNIYLLRLCLVIFHQIFFVYN